MKKKNCPIFTKLGEWTLLRVLSKATVQFLKNIQPFARSLTVNRFLEISSAKLLSHGM